jgi:hypothetical protein
MTSSMSGLFCKSNEAHDPAPIEILRSGLFDFILHRRGVVVRTSPKSLFLKIKIFSFLKLWILDQSTPCPLKLQFKSYS